MDPLEAFNDQRPLLFSIAYRMLGSAADAEDILQEAFLRWQESGVQPESLKAYLSTIVTRLCINQLHSAKAQREEYIGPWLPEPLTTETPDRAIKLADSLSMAFLVLLENLSPVERAVFLLRDVFEYEFSEIAGVVEKSETNCRQILRRARKKLSLRRSDRSATQELKQRLVQQFLQASLDGNLDGLLAVLAEDITLYSDGGGKVAAALNPILGVQNVARFLLGVRKKEASRLTNVRMTLLNGEPGLLLYQDDEVIGAMEFEVVNGRIRNLFIINNPDKLRRLS